MRKLFLLMMFCAIAITAKAQFPYGLKYGTTKDQVIEYLNSRNIRYEDMNNYGEVFKAEIPTFAGHPTCSIVYDEEFNLEERNIVHFVFYKNILYMVFMDFRYTPERFYSLENTLSSKYEMINISTFKDPLKKGAEFEPKGNLNISLGNISLKSETIDESISLDVYKNRDNGGLFITLSYTDQEVRKKILKDEEPIPIEDEI